MKEFKLIIKNNFNEYLLSQKFIEYSKGRTYIKLCENQIIQYVTFDRKDIDNAILVSFGVDCLFRKKTLAWSKKVILPSIGSRIGYFTPSHSENRWFEIQPEASFIKSKETILKIFEESLFPWFNEHTSIKKILEATNEPLFRQPDEGWNLYEQIFLELRLNQIEKAKIDLNSLLKNFDYLPAETISYCKELISSMNNGSLDIQSLLMEITAENIKSLRVEKFIN